MKNQGILVERYSQALFSLTEKQNSSTQILSELGNIVHTLSNEPNSKLFFSVLFPNVSQNKLWETLLKNLKCSKTVHGFVELLVKNSRIQLFDKIRVRYEHLVNESNGVIVAEISSSNKLDGKIIKKITTELESMTKKKIELKTFEDTSLMGGFVIKIGSKLYDSSIKSLLKNLETTLRNYKE